ncbi:MAG: hypothetical protein Q4P30_05070 [Eubacteriales bacterium]|nr:hypothetical protein [Eubacteriales bacterium]
MVIYRLLKIVGDTYYVAYFPEGMMDKPGYIDINMKTKERHHTLSEEDQFGKYMAHAIMAVVRDINEYGKPLDEGMRAWG